MKRPTYLLVIVLLMGIFLVMNGFGLSNGLPREEFKGLIFSSKAEMEELIPQIAAIRAKDYQEVRSSLEYRGTVYWDPNADWKAYFKKIEQEFPIQLTDRTVPATINKMKWMGGTLISSIMPDEQYIVNAVSQLRLKPLNLKLRFFHYGHFHIYSVGAVLLLAERLGVITLTTDREFYLKNPEMTRRIFVVGKLLGIFFGALAIPVVALLGNLLLDRKAGLLAAAFFTFVPQLALEARVLKPWVFGQFWLCLALLFIAKLMVQRRTRFYLLSGMTAGLAAGNGYFFIYPILILLMVHLFFWKEHQGLWDRWGRPASAVFLCALFLLATNPSILWSFEQFRATISRTNERGSFLHFFLDPAYHRQALLGFIQSLGVCLAWTTFGGLLLSLFKRSRTDLFLLGSFLVCYLLYFKSMSYQTAHHQIGFFVIAALLSAHLVTWFFREVRAPLFLKGTVTSLILLNLVSQSLFYTLVLALDHSFVEAGRWVNENVPKGASIGNFVAIDGGRLPGNPPYRLLNYVLVNDFDPGLSKIKKAQSDYYVAIKVSEAPGISYLDPFVKDRELLERYDLAKQFRYEVPWLGHFYSKDLVFNWIERIEIFKKKSGVL